MIHRAYKGLGVGTLVLAAVVCLAACGSSSAGSASSTTSTSSGAPKSRTALVACLKQHGVTLPTRGHFGGAGAPTGGAPGAGAPSGSGAPPAGGFGGGGFAGHARNPKFAAAFKACGGGSFGGFHRGAGGAGFRPHFSAATLSSFRACVKRHGYDLPKANTSGSGGIFPTSAEKSKTFQAAAKDCESILRAAFHKPGAATSTTS